MQATRRHFLTAAAAGMAVPTALGQRVSANDKIQIATIGIGGMGTADTKTALSLGDVAVVAVCDLYDGRRARAKEVFGDHLFTTRDYREVLARPDIDAIIIGTTDHYHARIATDAMNAGKDVYCEKPMVHSIDEGKAVIEAQKKTGRIMQVGSQRVSSIVYQKAKDLIKAGAIGELNMIEAWWDRNNAVGAFKSSIPPDASPATVDWPRFTAGLPPRPFDATKFFQWRGYRDYGTGVAGDLFVHLFSGVHFVLNSTGPSRAYGSGGIYFWKDGRDMPDLLLGVYDYPKSDDHPPFHLTLRVNFENGAGESSAFHFIGNEGVLTIENGVKVQKRARETEPGNTIETFTKAMQEEYLRGYRRQYPPIKASADAMRPDQIEEFLPPPGYSDHRDHHRSFFAAVRSRKPVVEEPVFGLRAAGPALLTNMSWAERKPLSWNPATMEVVA